MSKMHLVSTHTFPMQSREQFANQKSTLQTLESSECLLNPARFSSLSRCILKVALLGGKREYKDNFITGFAKTSEFNSDAQISELLLQWLSLCTSLNHSASFAGSIKIGSTCELL